MICDSFIIMYAKGAAEIQQTRFFVVIRVSNMFANMSVPLAR